MDTIYRIYCPACGWSDWWVGTAPYFFTSPDITMRCCQRKPVLFQSQVSGGGWVTLATAVTPNQVHAIVGYAPDRIAALSRGAV